LYSCGANSDGQLGLGDSRSEFTRVNVTNVKQVVSGYDQTYILKENGKVYIAGAYNYMEHDTFVRIDQPRSLIISQISGSNTTKNFFAISNDGNLWGFGDNTYGQLGLGNDNNIRNSLTLISGISNIKMVSCGKYFTYVVDNNNNVYCAGRNDKGQLARYPYEISQSNVFISVPRDSFRNISIEEI
jgi:alpha-tubulin suppressor-like RCC1 family protein